MIEQKEDIKRLSPFDEAANLIKKTGVYEGEFGSEESVDLMSEFVLSIIRKRGATDAKVVKMLVSIENNKGIIKGAVKVNKPVEATINLECLLCNDAVLGKIKLADLKVKTNAGLGARIAMKADNTIGKTRDELRKPNEAFGEFLSSKFDTKGVEIKKIGLCFNRSTLSVKLNGGPSC